MTTDPHTAFTGFDRPRQNWFKMPSNWTDITAAMSSIAELKVVEYVLKHTWGFQEYGLCKRITNDEFMHGRRRKDGTRLDKGTGLSKPSVIAGLQAAVAHGLLLEAIDDSDKARVKKYYSLRMMPGLDDEFVAESDEPPGSPHPGTDRGGVKDVNAGVKNLYPAVKTFYPRGKESLPRTEKETLERNLQEETPNNNSSEAPTQSAVVVALSAQAIADAEEVKTPFPATAVLPEPALWETPPQPSPDFGVSRLPSRRERWGGSRRLVDETKIPPPIWGRLGGGVPSAADSKAAVAAALLGLGLAATVTERLVSRYRVEQIQEKIAFLTYLQAQTPERVKNPRGWLRRAIEENYGPPDGFLAQAERDQVAQERAQQAAIAAAQAQAAAELAHTRQAALAAQQQALRQTLQAHYGTTDADYTFWEAVKQEISYLARPDLFALIADAHLLQRTPTTALIGIVHDHHLRRLSHPSTQTAIKRACTRITGAPIEPTFVLLTPPL